MSEKIKKKSKTKGETKTKENSEEEEHSNDYSNEEDNTLNDDLNNDIEFSTSSFELNLKDRTENLIAKIDTDTSVLLDAMVSLDLAPSRSAAAAYLLKKAYEADKDEFAKIVEVYNSIKKAKLKAKYKYYKTLKKDKRASKEKTEED